MLDDRCGDGRANRRFGLSQTRHILLGYGLVFVGWALLIAALLAGPRAGVYSIGVFVGGMAVLLLGMHVMRRKSE